MKSIKIITLLLLCSLYTWAQAPQKFNYQAVARDANGKVLENKAIDVRFSILDASPTGLSDYVEEHAVTTNALGLFNILIGEGNPLSGSFAAVDWNTGSKYLKVELDMGDGTGYQFMGTEQLVSVPYALNAGNSSASVAQLTDVNISGVSDGQVLKWNAANNQWEAANDIGGGTGDDWGAQVVESDNTLEGNGTNANPLKIAEQGANLNQVLKWNGSEWIPGNDSIGNSSSGIKILESGNLSSLSIDDNDLVKINGTITLTSNYSELDRNGLSISGGQINGGGTQEVSFDDNTIIKGVVFENLLIDASSTTLFIGCTFNNVSQLGSRSTFSACEFNNCSVSTTKAIGNINNSDINNSTFPRVNSISNCQIDDSTLGGTASGGTSLGELIGNDIDDCLLYPESLVSGNSFDDSKVVVQVGEELSITGNHFEGMYTGANEIIEIDYNDNNLMNVNISSNSFRGNSSTNRYIFLNGNYSGSYGLVKISNNSFVRGTQVISNSSSGLRTIITNNSIVSSSLGVSNGGDLTVRDNDVY